eukprot:gnl/TRDRNA2_/TRDRNA2_197879_c0_seq1.p1 gnl/TRDRNA2_/TRDRNA2_197879_c0~~gnl/TRDRNA2_/TRDRNA2_197879_c0_seq1.p1  ORF type:complete len:483 (+),score=88.88 gnl/TRDRNA2_/TRDRNA2_197879_c0_seq1:48-1451(+)
MHGLAEPLLQDTHRHRSWRARSSPAIFLASGFVVLLSPWLWIHGEDRQAMTMQMLAWHQPTRVLAPAARHPWTGNTRSSLAPRAQGSGDVQPANNPGDAAHGIWIFTPEAPDSGESELAKAKLHRWRAGPAEIHSGQGQMADTVLRNNPALFDAQVQEQLEAMQEQRAKDEWLQLELDKKSDDAEDDSAVNLRKRIAAIQRDERDLASSELIYLKACKMFQQLHVPMIPTLKGARDIKFGAIDLKNLTSEVHTLEALELVNVQAGEKALERLFEIISGQAKITPGTVLEIPLLEAGQVYAASAMFGYSLRNFDRRFQLEKLTKDSFGAWLQTLGLPGVGPLKRYISSVGPEVQPGMISISSLEAYHAMESHITSLFGEHYVLEEKFANALGTVTSEQDLASKLAEAVKANKVEAVRITSDDMTRLVLEAVAFGTLLNDAEQQVDTIYPLTPAIPSPSEFSEPLPPSR